MQLLNSLDISLKTPTAIAVGFFDGVHLGHKSVISTACNFKSEDIQCCVFSFEMITNSPKAKKDAKLISTSSLKAREMENIGVDIQLSPPFDSFMGMSPKEFAVDLLYKKLKAKVVCCGYDYRFGKGAAAGAKELAEFLSPYGVSVVTTDAVIDKNEPVSSSRIRIALEKGDINEANHLLGRPFAFDFSVSHGNKIGSSLGFPTANQLIPNNFCAPKYGVYATSVEINGKSYPSVTNVGIAPTIGAGVVRAESFILNFTGDIYGLPMKTSFFEFLREEQKFESLELLKSAIAKDATIAKNLHESL